jgi:hypothetical protein
MVREFAAVAFGRTVFLAKFFSIAENSLRSSHGYSENVRWGNIKIMLELTQSTK